MATLSSTLNPRAKNHVNIQIFDRLYTFKYVVSVNLTLDLPHAILRYGSNYLCRYHCNFFPKCNAVNGWVNVATNLNYNWVKHTNEVLTTFFIKVEIFYKWIRFSFFSLLQRICDFSDKNVRLKKCIFDEKQERLVHNHLLRW